ncbi:MAG TPA: MMPL family transporter [Myxococcota bacterium]
MTFRHRIEVAFEAWGRWVFHRPKRTITAVVLVVAALATQLSHVTYETSLESFLHERDPLRLRYEDFRREFGRDDLVLVAVEAADIFSFETLERLRDLHRDLAAEVPYLYEVTSLLNARETRGEADELVVGELLEDWPTTTAALEQVRERASGNRLYRNLLLSEDLRITTILLEAEAYSPPDTDADVLAGFDDGAAGAAAEEPRSPFLTAEENGAFIRTIEAVAARYDAPEFRVHISGMSAVSDYMMRTMQRDILWFTAMGVATIAVLLALLFRHLVGVALPLLIVILSMVCTIALMTILGQPITIPTQILPSFLLAVGVGDSVHVLVIFFQRLHRGDAKEDALAFAMGHSGLAIVMTSLTTAGALLSFVAAELAPVAVLGITAPAGVMIALLFTVVLLPALVSVFPIGAGTASERGRTRAIQRLLVRCGEFAVARARWVVCCSAALVAVAALGISQLQLSHSPIKWFPPDNAYRVATELMNERMGGALFLEILLDTGSENGLHEPRVLQQMDDMRAGAMSLEVDSVHAGATVSLADVVMEIHQALNENRPDFYAIPTDPALVAQELLLFENAGSDDLEDVVDPQFRVGRFTVKVPMVDAVEYGPYLDALGAEVQRITGNGAEVVFTGLMRVISGTIHAMMVTMVRSYLIAFAVIAPLMILLIGNFKLGTMSMIPNLIPIAIVLGIMGWLQLPLDAFTLLIGSIAIGLAVDDTIHFMHNFRRYYERSGEVVVAVRETLASTGQALLFTSLVLSSGFFIFTLASLNNLFYFGLLTGLTIVLAFLADLMLAPALMALVVGRTARADAPETALEETG